MFSFSCGSGFCFCVSLVLIDLLSGVSTSLVLQYDATWVRGCIGFACGNWHGKMDLEERWE